MTWLRLVAWILLLPALALWLLPSPLVWIFLGWAAALTLSARRGARRSSVRLALISAGLFVALALVEVVTYQPPPKGLGCAHAESDRPTLDDPFDGELGYGPEPGTQIRDDRLTGGHPDYSCLCTIDENGQRVTPPSEAEDAVLFFGGSYTFGNGVEDDQTTAWIVGEQLAERARVHNFACSGYGPHQMLAALQAGRVERIVEGRPRVAVFQLILSHVSRVAGRAGWDVHGPRYTLDEDGRAVRAGRFCDAPLPAPWYLWLARRSNLYRKIRSRMSPQSEVRLLTAVLDESRRELEARFPGCELHIIFWDEAREKADRMLAELEAGGFRVHRISALIEGYHEDRFVAYLSEDDDHPSVRSHARVARYVLESICAELAPE